jgi:hypothetical protein
MRKLFKYVIIVCSLALVAGSCMYFTYKGRQATKKLQHAVDDRSFLTDIKAPGEFIAMQGAPLSDKFNSVRTVKVVYDLGNNKFYFINSAKYEFHYNFCVDVLNCDVGLGIFNSMNYGSGKVREYLLANINHYEQSDTYTMEFGSEDKITPGQIELLYNYIKEHAYFGDVLRVFVNSYHLSVLRENGELKVPCITPTEIYKGQKYQVLNKGVAYGYLRIIKDLDKQYDEIKPEDIIIINGTPVNIPMCSGIIATSLQTPLSHINVLSHNRHLASAADINILQKPWLNEFINKPVVLHVNEDSIYITASTGEEVEKHLKELLNKKEVKLRYDLSETHLVPVREIGESDKYTIGNKAVGIGHLYRISKKSNAEFYIPEGAFGIPFYYYYKHINAPSIRSEIDSLLTKKNPDPKYVGEKLKKIRKAIKAAPVDPKLLEMVAEQIKKANAGNAYRFRSSSNAEDMAGFSGAGLYDSKTGIIGDTAKPIDKAIKEVWASAWSEPAYTEREYFNINQHSMMMGVLVHRSFPDEIANGVAITKNIYRKDFPGFTINVQQGEVSVVSPPDKVTCEQFICMRASEIDPLNPNITADYITHSSITNGAKVLSMQQVKLLHEQLELIKQYFYYRQSSTIIEEYNNFGLDLEFKFEKNGRLYIKQVRPYQ